MVNICALVFDGMTNLDFAGPYEVFARIPDTKVTACSASGAPVSTDLGLVVPAQAALPAIDHTDVLFIGGGPGVNQFLEDDKVLAHIERIGTRAKWVTSVCTGTLLLGAAGLLRGYKATTHWGALDILGVFEAIPVAERVVVDRNRITGGGVTAGIDFGFYLASAIQGDAFAKGLQLMLEYAPAPPFDCGSPATAPAELVEQSRAKLARLTQRRFELSLDAWARRKAIAGRL